MPHSEAGKQPQALSPAENIGAMVQGGMFVWLKFLGGVRDYDDLLDLMLEEKVSPAPGEDPCILKFCSTLLHPLSTCWSASLNLKISRCSTSL